MSSGTDKLTSHRRYISVLLALALIGCEKDYSPQEYYERAKSFEKKGEFHAAEIELKNALIKKPDFPSARFELVDIYLKRGMASEAERELHLLRDKGVPAESIKAPMARVLLMQQNYAKLLREITVSPTMSVANTAEILALRANALLQQGKVATACESFGDALKVDEASTLALRGMAGCALANNRAADAEQYLQAAVKANPNDADNWYVLANLSQRQRQFDKALQHYSHAIELNPLHLDALSQRVLLHLDAKRFDSAKDDINRISAARKDFWMLGYLRGLLQFNNGKIKEAVEQFTQTEKMAPDYLPALWMLGTCHYMLKNQEQASLYLGRVYAARPDSAAVASMAALALGSFGKKEEARQILDRLKIEKIDDPRVLAITGNANLLAGNFRSAVEQLQLSVSRQPQQADAHINLARAMLANGDANNAIKTLEGLVASGQMTTEAQALLLDLYLVQKRYVDANKFVDRLAGNHVDQAKLEMFRGYILQAQGKSAEAKASLARALDMQPKLGGARLMLANIAITENHPDEARIQLKRAIELDDRFTPAYTGLAQVELKQGNRKAAVDVLEAGVAKQPQEPNLVALLAEQLLPQTPARVLQLVEPILVASPKNARLQEIASRAYLAQRAFPAAIAALKKWSELSPADASPKLLLANALSASGDRAAAGALLARAVELHKGNRDLLLAKARLHLENKQPEMAASIVQELRRTAPNFFPAIWLDYEMARADNRLDQARASLKAAASLVADSAAACALVTQAYISLDDKETAVKLAQNFAATYPERVAAVELLGDTLVSIGNQQAALAAYRKGAVLDSKSVSLTYKIAMTLAATNDLGGAEQSLNRAIELNPAFLDAYLAKGMLLLRKKDYAAAAKVAQEVQKRFTGSVHGYRLEADVLTAQNKLAEAAKVHERAYFAAKSAQQAFNAYRSLHRAVNDTRGIEILQDWVNTSPRDKAGRMMLAKAMERAGKIKAALEQHEWLLVNVPNDPAVMNEAALAFHAAGAPKGRQLAEQAYMLRNRDPIIADTYGWILAEKGETQKALPILKFAREAAPANTEIQLHYIDALAKAGEIKPAQLELWRLIGEFPALKERQDVRKLMLQLPR